MVQFKILSGKQAGTTVVARRFPVQIGRSEAATFRFDEPGVWDNHLLLDFKPAEGFSLSTHPSALVAVNGQPVSQCLLRNGDIIEIASLKLQFWLSETVQSGLRFRESFIWALIGAVCLVQVALVYWLLR
jgi:pSer/pThr/pTyr-binding forkhead associated (FHA) protein